MSYALRIDDKVIRKRKLARAQESSSEESPPPSRMIRSASLMPAVNFSTNKTRYVRNLHRPSHVVKNGRVVRAGPQEQARRRRFKRNVIVNQNPDTLAIRRSVARTEAGLAALSDKGQVGVVGFVSHIMLLKLAGMPDNPTKLAVCEFVKECVSEAVAYVNGE